MNVVIKAINYEMLVQVDEYYKICYERYVNYECVVIKAVNYEMWVQLLEFFFLIIKLSGN